MVAAPYVFQSLPCRHLHHCFVQVVGRLAGDQRGVVLDALVSAGMMEMLLAVVEDNAASSAESRAAESGLALLLLADLAAGSEKAKVRGWGKPR